MPSSKAIGSNMNAVRRFYASAYIQKPLKTQKTIRQNKFALPWLVASRFTPTELNSIRNKLNLTKIQKYDIKRRVLINMIKENTNSKEKAIQNKANKAKAKANKAKAKANKAKAKANKEKAKANKNKSLENKHSNSPPM